MLCIDIRNGAALCILVLEHLLVVRQGSLYRFYHHEQGGVSSHCLVYLNICTFKAPLLWRNPRTSRWSTLRAEIEKEDTLYKPNRNGSDKQIYTNHDRYPSAQEPLNSQRRACRDVPQHQERTSLQPSGCPCYPHYFFPPRGSHPPRLLPAPFTLSAAPPR
jgi:hypothetical protein